jgi:hypothetical protein
VAVPSLPGAAGVAGESFGKMQVCINDVARTVCRSSRMDHVRVEDVVSRERHKYRHH